MHASRPSTLLVLLPVLACAPEPASEPLPEPIGPLVYRVVPTWCGSPCDTLELYRQGDTVQLLAITHEGVVGETRARLTEASAMQLDADADALLSGEVPLGELDAMCLSFHDRPLVTLAIGKGVELGYPGGCAPAGAAGLDAVYGELVVALPECAASAHYVDCEPL